MAAEFPIFEAPRVPLRLVEGVGAAAVEAIEVEPAPAVPAIVRCEYGDMSGVSCYCTVCQQTGRAPNDYAYRPGSPMTRSIWT